MERGTSRWRRQEGFTLVELLVTMVIFVLTIAAATSIFVPLLTQFKQQSRVTETQTEGLVGIETLRRDIEMGGYGLPWSLPSGVGYLEASAAPASNYNDSTATPRTPKAFRGGNNVAFAGVMDGSDYLVIKSMIIATNSAAGKWTEVMTIAGGARRVRQWASPPSEIDDLKPGDSVIVLDPAAGKRTLKKNDTTGAFYTPFSATFPSEFSPSNAGEVYLIYGVDSASLRMPFNRADFFVDTSVALPERCARNTGFLTKAVVSQADGTLQRLPLLDCVADMQVHYRLDTDNDGVLDTDRDDLAGLSAENIHDQVKEVRVYILAHEGQGDTSYTFTGFTPGACATCIRVGEPLNGPGGLAWGRDFNLAARIPNYKGFTYQNYRWKVYTLVLRPKNLR